MPDDLSTLRHALTLLRPWYSRRHTEMVGEVEDDHMTAQEMHRESRMLTWIIGRIESASRAVPDDLLPGYRYSDGDLLNCLDDQIEHLISADAVTIADIEALAEARALFMGDQPAPETGELDVEINLAGLLQHPDEVREVPSC